MDNNNPNPISPKRAAKMNSLDDGFDERAPTVTASDSEEEEYSNPNRASNLQDSGEQQLEEEASQGEPNRISSGRTPFTDLSQVDADWALARTLQEQERAYMMLRINNEGSDYGSWETWDAGSNLPEDNDFDDPNPNEDGEPADGTDVDDEDAFDIHAHEDLGEDHTPALVIDPADFSSDEAYARALQDAEEREMAVRMLALAEINDRNDGDADADEHAEHMPDTWEEVDPDELSYEELLALGDVVGSESRGLSADAIASLPSMSYTAGGTRHGCNDSCVICRLDYEDGETLTVLSCKHSYHLECLNNWLKINKVCPVCSVEVVSSGNS